MERGLGSTRMAPTLLESFFQTHLVFFDIISFGVTLMGLRSVTVAPRGGREESYLIARLRRYKYWRFQR